jgi:hypothetical protein
MAYADIMIYPPNSSPLGKTFNEWCILWWKWLLGIQKPNNPAHDMTGDNAYINQINADVFFLCQTFERTRIYPLRKVKIPNNKKIFLPILNWISYRDQENQSEGNLRLEAADRMDRIGMLKFSINEKPIEENLVDFRIRTSIFEVDLPKDNILGAKSGLTTVVSDGYWLFLESNLKEISISSLGSCSSGVTEIGTNYHIIFTNE